MNFTGFIPAEYSDAFENVIQDLVPSLTAASDDESSDSGDMIQAMRGSIDIMARVESDQHSQQSEPLPATDITQIGDYALSLLEALSIQAANRGLQKTMLQLQRLSLPVALWVEQHQGTVNKLDIVVNAIASYANEITEPKQLAELCQAISCVVAVVGDDIRRDIEATNPMRPWRVLNLNWGIVATRSHDVALMEQVFEALIKNIPADANAFFREGMQQMDIIGYPDHVRQVMEKYHKQLGNDARLH